MGWIIICFFFMILILNFILALFFHGQACVRPHAAISTTLGITCTGKDLILAVLGLRFGRPWFGCHHHCLCSFFSTHQWQPNTAKVTSFAVDHWSNQWFFRNGWL